MSEQPLPFTMYGNNEKVEVRSNSIDGKWVDATVVAYMSYIFDTLKVVISNTSEEITIFDPRDIRKKT